MSEYSFELIQAKVVEINAVGAQAVTVGVDGPPSRTVNLPAGALCPEIGLDSMVLIVEATPNQDASKQFQRIVVAVAGQGCLNCQEIDQCLHGQVVAAFRLNMFNQQSLSPEMQALVRNAHRQ